MSKVLTIAKRETVDANAGTANAASNIALDRSVEILMSISICLLLSIGSFTLPLWLSECKICPPVWLRHTPDRNGRRNMRGLMNIIKSFFWQATLVLAFFGVVFTSLYGVRLTENVTKTVGHFRLSETVGGVSIFQYDTHAAYQATVFNDYFINQQGQRYAFIPYSDLPAQLRETNVYDQLPEQLQKLPQMYKRLRNYYGADTVVNKFKSENGDFEYRINENGRTLTVTHLVNNRGQTAGVRIWGTTLAYSRDDLVFDNAGNLYTENPDMEVRLLANMFGKTIVRNDSSVRRAELPSKIIYILNPRVPGALALRVSEMQTAYVNKDYRIIELEEPAKAEKQRLDLTVEVLDNL